MKQPIRVAALMAVTALFLIAACSKVPITGRKQFSLIPDATINQLSNDQYRSFLGQNKVVTGTADASLVKDVGQRISKAVDSYFAKQKDNPVKGFKWEFNLIESKDVNAWCMPGGKVAVYTGILPTTMDENGLAVVMGHEIAHAVAQHGSERMTQGLIQQVGAIGLAVALQNKPAQTQELFMQAYGIGTTVGVMLPFSRNHETEADKLGLVFAAMAGYDPQAAVPFWQRMNKLGGAKPPEFLSTHPSDATRIKNLQDFMPTAMKYYKKSPNIKPNQTTNHNTTNNSGKQPANKTTNTNTNDPATIAPNNKDNTKPQRIKVNKVPK
ncbi:MAG: M48 family metallopeptidase [Sphingobacteriales bacterium]|nr:MAG: M48 family metallopeptidase [Sphingobacteriales bacterium]